ncbi:MAG TPA: YibE/F family protein, partial [Spirochaetia bacterium]|nr:YibE/F family protein [Spirochaetia bacterium]
MKTSWARWVVIVAGIGVYVAVGLYLASHTSIYRLYRSGGTANVRYEKAIVLGIQDEELVTDKEHGGLLTGYQDVSIRLIRGERAGTELRIQNVLNYTSHFLLKKGDTIIVHVDTADADHFTVSVYSVNRVPVVCLLALAFVAALCGIGGSRGFRSLLGMVFTLSSIFLFFIPLLYRGCSPTLAVTVMAAATIAVSLLLLGGLSVKSAAAIAGSFVGIGISALLAWAAQNMAQISGYTTAEVDSLLAIAGQTG